MVTYLSTKKVFHELNLSWALPPLGAWAAECDGVPLDGEPRPGSRPARVLIPTGPVWTRVAGAASPRAGSGGGLPLPAVGLQTSRFLLVDGPESVRDLCVGGATPVSAAPASVEWVNLPV